MPWYGIKFTRKKPISRDKYKDLVQDWLWSLERFEHIYEENSLVWTGEENLEAVVCATRLDALDQRFYNKYIQTNYEKVISKSKITPNISIREHLPQKKWPLWMNANELYLYTDYFREGLAVKEGKKGMGIPIYQLPLDPDKGEQIAFWAIRYRQFDGIQLGCGELEIPAYKQMAEVKSGLSKSGRDVCRLIEMATGKPTYYYLHRYWGWENKEKERNRKCPACGGKWRVLADSKNGIGRYEFKCEKCRIISDTCCSTESDKYAKIGFYKPKKRIKNGPKIAV